MGTQGKGTYVINSGWSSGSLVFYEKAVGRTVTGDIFTIGASQVTIGGTGQDVDFLVYLGGASNYFKLDCGAKTAAFYGVDVTVTGDLTIASEDLALGDNCSLEFGDATDLTMTWDGTNFAIIPAADGTGEIQFGNDGTKSMDVRFYGATASYNVLWDMNGGTNGAWLFGADTYGITVSMYAITTGCGVFWTPSGDSNNGTFILGASGGSKGTDLYAYGATNGNYLQWDQSANSLKLVGTSSVLDIAGTTASTSTTTGAVIIDGGVGIAGAVFGTTIGLSGALTITPTAAGTFLDFVLETEWVSGTLINADFGSATTLSSAVVGVNLDLGANVVATSEQSVKAIDINLPQMTVDAASPTVKGIEITAQGAIVQTTSGTTTFTALDITLPAITQTAGTVTSTGIKITSGAVTSGTQIGLQVGIDGTGADVYFYGATPSAYMQWDESADSLILAGASILSIAGTVTQTVAALGNDARGASFKFTQATPAVSDGYAAFEIETTVSGIATGMHSALSSWVNITGSGAMGANIVSAQQNGIYADAGSNTGSIVIFGMRAHAILNDAPTVLAPFSLNTSNREITGLFEMAANPDVGYRADAGTSGAKVGDVPLFCDNNGQQYFVRIYSARG